MYCREERSSAVRLIAGNRNLVKGYSQSALLLAHNLIAAIAAFQWESVLPLKQGSPNPSLSPWCLEAGDFLDGVKIK